MKACGPSSLTLLLECNYQCRDSQVRVQCLTSLHSRAGGVQEKWWLLWGSSCMLMRLSQPLVCMSLFLRPSISEGGSAFWRKDNDAKDMFLSQSGVKFISHANPVGGRRGETLSESRFSRFVFFCVMFLAHAWERTWCIISAQWIQPMTLLIFLLFGVITSFYFPLMESFSFCKLFLISLLLRFQWQ